MADEANPDTGADATAFDNESAGLEDLVARLEAEDGESDGAPNEVADQSDEAGETEADADGQEGEPAEETEEEQAPARTFKVKTPDGEIEVDERELVEGYKRQADYMRNIQQVKAVQKELASVASEASTVGHRAALQAMIQADTLLQLENSAALAELRATDPGEYAATVADIEARKGWWQSQLASVDQLAARARTAVVARESEALRQAVPELADPTKATAFLQDVLQVGQRFGLSEQDMDQVTDHRVVLMAKALADAERKLSAREAVQKSIQGKRVAAPSIPAGSAKATQRVDPRSTKQLARTLSGRDGAAHRDALRRAFD